MSRIQPATLSFLSRLAENNNREWFAENKDDYDASLKNVKSFLADLSDRMNQGDDVDKSRLFRIYRDVRFSKEKLPYHARFGMSLGRRKPLLRGGYMVSIRPSQTTVAAGFWGPNAADLATIRANINLDGEHLQEAITDSGLRQAFGELAGSTVKTAPRGFKQDHPHIELLRHKQFIFSRTFEPRETTAMEFLDQVVFTLRSVRPFFDYMSEILTHDLNGVPLY